VESPGEGPAPPDPLVGRILSDRYHVLRKLGEGGVGHVYLAEHLGMGRTVALKVLSAEHMASAQAAAEFIDEAKTVGKIGHHNIIDIYYGAQTPDGLVFLAMEYLEGRDLGRVLMEEGPLPWERLRPIFLQATSALAAVHAHGIVHRDLKPDNLFLVRRSDGGEMLKVLDFGVAKALGTLELTQRSVSGTPQYMSPEQTVGRDVDHRSDIYSLGCVMYQMVTGALPFTAESVIDLMAKHSYEAPQPPRERRPDLNIPLGVEKVVLRAMEKNPAHRFSSMQEMHESMARLRMTSSTALPATHDSHRALRTLRLDDPIIDHKTRRRYRLAVALTAVSLSGPALAVYMSTRPDPRARVLVRATPETAEILLDGEIVATRTPALILVPAGEYQVWARAPGYVPQPLALAVARKEERTITLGTLVSPATTLKIESRPPGREIWLDGEPLMIPNEATQARTPFVARRLRPGPHVVELRGPAGGVRESVDVAPDVEGTVELVLPEDNARPGAVPAPARARGKSSAKSTRAKR
jgi:serine/threonine-protein kinase